MTLTKKFGIVSILTLAGLMALSVRDFSLAAPPTPEHTGAIIGDVVLKNGSPVKGAMVEVKSNTGKEVIAKLESDGNGQFKVGDLRPGMYAVSASKRGMGSTTVRANVYSNRTSEVRIILTGSGL